MQNSENTGNGHGGYREGAGRKPNDSGHGGAREGAGRKTAGYVKSAELQDLDKQKARHEKIKADLAELEFRKVSGELVDRSEVRRASATALATLAQGLRSVRDIVERKYNVSPEIADAIGKEIDDALDNLATAFEKMCAAPTTDIEIDDSEDLFADD